MVVGGTGPATASAMPASLASLMTGHVLRDGEIIILILKPSLWSIALEMIRFTTAMLIAVIACSLWVHHPRYCIEAAVLLLVMRTVWAVLNWMGHLYVLSDQRIIRMSGIFTCEIDDCPLRKVVRARLLVSAAPAAAADRLHRDHPPRRIAPIWTWQWVGQPRKVHEQVLRAIRRAKQGTSCLK